MVLVFVFDVREEYIVQHCHEIHINDPILWRQVVKIEKLCGRPNNPIGDIYSYEFRLKFFCALLVVFCVHPTGRVEEGRNAYRRHDQLIVENFDCCNFDSRTGICSIQPAIEIMMQRTLSCTNHKHFCIPCPIESLRWSWLRITVFDFLWHQITDRHQHARTDYIGRQQIFTKQCTKKCCFLQWIIGLLHNWPYPMPQNAEDSHGSGSMVRLLELKLIPCVCFKSEMQSYFIWKQIAFLHTWNSDSSIPKAKSVVRSECSRFQNDITNCCITFRWYYPNGMPYRTIRKKNYVLWISHNLNFLIHFFFAQKSNSSVEHMSTYSRSHASTLLIHAISMFNVLILWQNKKLRRHRIEINFLEFQITRKSSIVDFWE